MNLTAKQIMALVFLAEHEWATPAQLGEAIGGTKRGNAQGLGRLGGTMAWRLRRMGLVENASELRGGFAAYRITAAGREALK